MSTLDRHISLTLSVLAPSALVALLVVGCFIRQPRAGSTFRDCDECPLMVVIPSGSFVMGDSLYGPPPHRVAIRKRFAVSKDLITRGEYARFVAGSGYAGEGSWRSPNLTEGSLDPAVDVSWYDAQAYVGWLSVRASHHYRLLSESEYEYAERAGSSTAFWWGEEAAPVCAYANFHNCSGGTSAVGRYRPNAFGLDDMTGNVFEWVEDCWHPDYSGAPADNTAWISGECSARVMRGSPWFMKDPTPLRSSYRAESDSVDRSDVIGFRVARIM